MDKWGMVDSTIPATVVRPKLLGKMLRNARKQYLAEK